MKEDSQQAAVVYYSGLTPERCDGAYCVQWSQESHAESMARILAGPIEAAYCITVIAFAVVLIVFKLAHYRHLLDLEECISGERENMDDNKTRIELAKCGHPEQTPAKEEE